MASAERFSGTRAAVAIIAIANMSMSFVRCFMGLCERDIAVYGPVVPGGYMLQR